MSGFRLTPRFCCLGSAVVEMKSASRVSVRQLSPGLGPEVSDASPECPGTGVSGGLLASASAGSQSGILPEGLSPTAASEIGFDRSDRPRGFEGLGSLHR